MEIDIGPLEPSGFATAQTGEEEEEQEVARHFVGKGTDRQVPVSKLVVGNDSSAGMDALFRTACSAHSTLRPRSLAMLRA